MVLGTDGDQGQIASLRMFLLTLKSSDPSIFEDWNIVIIHPQNVTTDRLCLTDIAPKLSFCAFDLVKSKDRYYPKLLLKTFVENNGMDDDVLLYLDCDHIARSKIHLPLLMADEIYVASETKPLLPVVDASQFSYTLQERLSHTHYNTSLIFCTNRTFKIAAREWPNLYQSCADKVALRYREEVAFCLSAVSSGCRVIPVALTLQSGWQSSVPQCALFHYGGEHQLAKAVKELLGRTRTCPKFDLPRETEFASEIFQLIRELG